MTREDRIFINNAPTNNMQAEWINVADSNKDSDFFMVKQNPELINRKVIEDIKADILSYKDDKIIHAEQNEMIDIVLEIIDKHIKGVSK